MKTKENELVDDFETKTVSEASNVDSEDESPRNIKKENYMLGLCMALMIVGVVAYQLFVKFF